jgi:hypothetical protein
MPQRRCIHYPDNQQHKHDTYQLQATSLHHPLYRRRHSRRRHIMQQFDGCNPSVNAPHCCSCLANA